MKRNYALRLPLELITNFFSTPTRVSVFVHTSLTPWIQSVYIHIIREFVAQTHLMLGLRIHELTNSQKYWKVDDAICIYNGRQRHIMSPTTYFIVVHIHNVSSNVVSTSYSTHYFVMLSGSHFCPSKILSA